MSRTIGFLLPVFNEAENIPDLLEYLELIRTRYENIYPGNHWYMVFCDNCSFDSTTKLIAGIKSVYINVKLIEFAQNYGFHFSTSYLLSSSPFDLSVLIPADMQIPMDCVLESMLISTEKCKSVFLCRSQQRWDKSSVPLKLLFQIKSVFYKILSCIESKSVSGYYGMGAYCKNDIAILSVDQGFSFRPFQLRLVMPNLIRDYHTVLFRELARRRGSSGFGLLRYFSEAFSIYFRSSFVFDNGLKVLALLPGIFFVFILLGILIVKLFSPLYILPGFATIILLILLTSSLHLLGLYLLSLKFERNFSVLSRVHPIVRSNIEF